MLEQRQATGNGSELDGGVIGVEFCEERVDRADVVHVRVGKENASDGRRAGAGGVRISSAEPGRLVSMRVRPSLS